jgi:hypothetical protein
LPRYRLGYAVIVRCVRILLVLAAAIGTIAPAASASDRSVKRAWDADDAAFARHGNRVRAYYREWRQSGFRKKRRLLRELGATRDTLDGTRAGVRAEEPSTETGRKAKYWALRSMRALDADLATEQSAVRACSAGKRRRCKRLFAEADDLVERSARFARRAKRLFRRALS